MIWIVYIVIVLLLIAVFLFASRRKETNVQVTNYELPTYIDITDIKSNSKDFFVIIFSSENCDGCKIVLEKAKVLESNSVAVEEISYQTTQGKKLHLKYQIEAVPSLLIVDKHGNVIKTYMGNVTATDLWAAVAQARGSELGCTDSGSCTSH